MEDRRRAHIPRIMWEDVARSERPSCFRSGSLWTNASSGPNLHFFAHGAPTISNQCASGATQQGAIGTDEAEISCVSWRKPIPTGTPMVPLLQTFLDELASAGFVPFIMNCAQLQIVFLNELVEFCSKT